MKKYLSDIFGVNVKIENWDGKLPIASLFAKQERVLYAFAW